MALSTKEERLILLKDLNGVNKAIIEKGITAPNSEKVLSILKDNASTDVITSLANYTEFYNHITTPGFKPWIQKALFIKDMEGRSVPINPDESTILTKFTKGESAIVYMDDTPTAFNGNGRPHFLKFMADTTLRKIGITFISTYAKLNAEPDQAWYFVENMAGYGNFKSYESALVYKWNSTNLEVWRSDESDFMDGTDIDLLASHTEDVKVLTTSAPGSTSSDAIFMFGNLSDSGDKGDFVDAALDGQWGTATIDNIRYLFNVVSGQKTGTINISGFRIINHGTEKAFEAINGTVNKADAPDIKTGTVLGSQTLTANYASQVDNLKAIESLSDLTPGLKKDYTFPNGLTTETVGGCEIALNYTVGGEIRTKTQGFDLRGWDKTKPLFLPVTYHSDTTYVWVELKLETVAGDNTKYSLTNTASGVGANQMDAFGAASIQFRGGQ